MKNILLMSIVFFNCFSLYPQDYNLQDIVTNIVKDKHILKICIGKARKHSYTLNKDELHMLHRERLTTILLSDGNESDLFLSYINSYKNFDLYYLLTKDDLKREINVIVSNSGGQYLLVDRKNNIILHLKTISRGDVFKPNNNNIELPLDSNIESCVTVLHDNFIPYISIESSQYKFEYCNYKLKENTLLLNKYNVLNEKNISVSRLPYQEFLEVIDINYIRRNNVKEENSKSCDCSSSIINFLNINRE